MSFYTALTGLNAATAQLAVTSSNIANVGTSGFKRSRADFGDIFATSPLQKASSVVGQGSALKQVSQEFSQGNIQFSANSLDLAITGDGFFPLKSADGLQDIYTRNGAFTMNDQFNVVNTVGQALMAASVDSSGKADLSNLNRLTIPRKTTGQAKQTSLVELGLNFPADAPVITVPFNRNNPASFNKTTALTVYDQGGNGYLATVYYVKTQNASQAAPTNKWQTYVYIGNSQVNASLQQATNTTGEKLYVNKYGQLQPESAVSDELVNRKTQMFSLDDLTDKRDSIPASTVGASLNVKVNPERGADLTADGGLDFSTLTSIQKTGEDLISDLSKAFQIDIDGSGQLATVDLSKLTANATKLTGSDIAKEMTNILNRQFGDDKSWDLASDPDLATKMHLMVGATPLDISLAKPKVEKLTFSAVPSTTTASTPSITVGGISVTLASGDTAIQVAAKVATAINNSFTTAGRTVVDNGDGTLTITKSLNDKRDSITTTAARQSEKLTLGAATTEGNITVAGVTVALAAGDSAASVATKVKTALEASTYANTASGRTITNNGSGSLTITKLAADASTSITTADTGTTGVTFTKLITSPYVSITDSEVTAYDAPLKKQMISFGDATKAGIITVGGVAVTGITEGMTAAEIATRVKTVLDSDLAYGSSSGRTIALSSPNDGSLTITYSPVDGNAAPLTYADGGTGVSSMIRTTQNFYGSMSQEELVTLMQTKIDAAIAASSTPTLDVTVSYDEVAKGFKFTAAGGEEIKVGGGTTAAPIANSTFGLLATDLTVSPNGTYGVAGSEVTATGKAFRELEKQRYGISVLFDSVAQKFSISSGTSGDDSAIKIVNSSVFAKKYLGITNTEVAKTADALRGIASEPAVTYGTAIALNVNKAFPVPEGRNKFLVTVDGVQGEVTIPPSENYTLDNFMSQLQSGINQLAGPNGSSISGVKVSYNQANNSFVFTTGTTGSKSFIKVSGHSDWGLLNIPAGRGVTSSWIKPKQYLEGTGASKAAQYIDERGDATSSADGYTTLPKWSPVYLDRGELTFSTNGSLVSPKAGTQLDTIYLDDGKGALRININYSKSTQFTSPFSVNSQSQDGAPEGDLVGVNIGDDGLVGASYSNGSQLSLGKIILANFSNPNGLRQIGDSSFYSTSASGKPTLGEAGGAGFGTVRAGARERANVDLTQELVDLITAQRNFQASAKAIETSTSLTQSIIQIRA